jgi:hypothetical protein
MDAREHVPSERPEGAFHPFPGRSGDLKTPRTRLLMPRQVERNIRMSAASRSGESAGA